MVYSIVPRVAQQGRDSYTRACLPSFPSEANGRAIKKRQQERTGSHSMDNNSSDGLHHSSGLGPSSVTRRILHVMYKKIF